METVYCNVTVILILLLLEINNEMKLKLIKFLCVIDVGLKSVDNDGQPKLYL